MVENKTRGEQLFEQAKEARSSSGIENPFKGKYKKILADIRGLFNKPQIKGSLKPAPNVKKATDLFSAIFSAQKLDLRSINQMLAIVLAGLAALTAYVIFRQPPNISAVTAAISKIKFQDLKADTIAPFDQLTSYLEQITKRDIFDEYVEYVPPPAVKVEPPSLPPPPPKITIQEKAKNLKLMGVSWGNSPKVIIKNESTQEVYFLEAGQKIEGTEITVKKISQEDVVISSDGDEMKML